jgi:hypothetical protein
MIGLVVCGDVTFKKFKCLMGSCTSTVHQTMEKYAVKGDVEDVPCPNFMGIPQITKQERTFFFQHFIKLKEPGFSKFDFDLDHSLIPHSTFDLIVRLVLRMVILISLSLSSLSLYVCVCVCVCVW